MFGKKIPKDVWVMLGAFALMVAATAAVVYWPQSRKLERLEAQIVADTEALKLDGEKTKVIPDMQRRLESMRSRYRGWDRKLPRQQDLGQFLSEISTQLRHKQLASRTIEPRNPQREELFHTLPIIIKLDGSYASLVEFLRGMREMERLTRVQTMKILSNPAEEDVEIEVQLNIYFTES